MEGARVQVPPRATSSKLMITMLKCNCRCCSHVVDVEQSGASFSSLKLIESLVALIVGRGCRERDAQLP